MSKVLLVDDEETLLQGLSYSLRQEGYQVVVAADGHSGLAMAAQEQPDIIVLDLMLPGLDGFEVCRQLRADSNVPIVMLTAKEDDVDRIVGLELGADDYLVKPFAARALIAHLRAILRRRRLDSEPAEKQLKVGPLEINPQRRLASLSGQELNLKAKEFDVLEILAHRPGQVFTASQLLEQAWGYAYTGDTRTVHTHIKMLRKKLAAMADTVRIETVHGVGYRLRAQGA